MKQNREMLLALADRIEKATGPDRELDIAMLPLVGLRFVDEGHPIGQVCYDSNNHAVPMPRFTASLDAAMSLVPEGWAKNIYDDAQVVAVLDCQLTGAEKYAHAKTWPLALCAAALRATASSHPTGDDQ